MLKKKTLNFIDRLRNIDWFANIGVPIDDTNVLQVHSWQDAISYAQRALYRGSPRMEARGMLTRELSQTFGERYAQWNILTEKINERIDTLITQLVSEVGEKVHLLKTSASEDTAIAIKADIRGACIELEYADIVEPKYFLPIAEWYSCGHFPCGWKGNYPKGPLVVF